MQASQFGCSVIDLRKGGGWHYVHPAAHCVFSLCHTSGKDLGDADCDAPVCVCVCVCVCGTLLLAKGKSDEGLDFEKFSRNLPREQFKIGVKF